MCSLRRVGAVLAAVVVLLAGCSRGVAPEEWASRVCQALAPWTEEIATLTQDAQAEMAKATTPEEAKRSIVTLLRGAEEASEEARRGVEEAGIPAVDDGERIAEEFVAALEAARDAYGSAREAVEQLPTNDADAFYDGVVDAMAQLTEDYNDSAVDTSDLSSDELQQAFDEVPECQG